MVKQFFLLILGGFFFLGCASSPPKKTANQSSGPSASLLPPKKKKKAFDYQKYVSKNQLEKKTTGKNKAEEKKKKHYEKLLKSMTRELKEKWAQNKKKAQFYWQKSLEEYYHLELRKSKTHLIQTLNLHPSHQLAKKLHRRVIFLLGERSGLLEDTLAILKEEKEIFTQKRMAYFAKLFTQGEAYLKHKKNREAQRLFKKIFQRFQWAQRHGILPLKARPYSQKCKIYLDNLLKKEKKL